MERDALSPAPAQHAIPSTGPQPDRAREYAALVSMADAIYCVDTTGHVTFVNAAFEAMSGHALADLRGTPSTRLYVPEAEALFLEFLERRRHVYSGATVPPYLETVLLLKDGRRLPVELSVSNLIIDGQTAGRVGVVRDLTARQQTEQALRQSEAEARLLLQLHQTIMANMGEGVYTLDAQGRVTYMNPEAERLLGWKTEELLGRRMHDVTHYQRPDGSPFPLEECAGFQVLREGKALKDVEDTFIRKDASCFPVSYSSSLLRSANGQVVGLVVVFQDITERKQAEEALARWQHVIYQAGWAVAIANPDDNTLQAVNPAFAAMHGYAIEELVGKPLADTVAPESRSEVPQQVQAAHQKGDHVYESTHIRKDGTRFPCLTHVTAFKDGSGRVVYRAATFQDLTDIRAAEQALRESEHRLRLALEAGRMGTWEWRLATNEVLWSPDLEALHGLAPGTFAGTFAAYQNDMHPDDRERVLRALVQTVEQGEDCHIEYRIVLPSGGIRWVEGRGNLIQEASGVPSSMIGVCMDITDRKQAEQALRKSEARLRAVIETAVDGMITIDARGQVDSINPAAVRLFGYAPQEVIGRNITLFMPEPYQSEHDTYLDNYVKTGTKKIIGIGREVVGLRKDGSTFPMDLAVSETTLDDRRLFTGIVRDISKRKATQETLRVRARQQQAVAKLGELALRERQLQAVFEHAMAMAAETLEVDYSKVLELLPEGKELRLRAGVGWQEGLVGTATVGTDCDSQAGYSLLSDAPVVVEDLRQETRFSGPPLLTDHSVISGMSHVIRGTDGRPWGVLGIHSTRRLVFTPDDVNFLAAVANILSGAIAREQAEAALRESEERFRVLADSAPVAIWMSGVDKLCTHFNKGWLDFTGRTMEQELGNGWAEGVHPDDFERCLHTYVTAFDTRQAFEMEYRLRRYDGEYRWIVDIGIPRYLPSGEFTGYIGSCIDITERKRAEDRFRLVVEAAPSALLMVDEHGVMTLVNSQTEQLFGYSRAELLGQPVEMLVPERFRAVLPGCREAFFQAPTTRAIGAGRDLFGLRKDGGEVPIEIGLNPLHTEEGQLVLASIIDITERAQAAQRLMNSLREKEVLLREIHHRVKNNLAVINSLLYLQSSTTQDEQTLRMLQNCRDRVYSMALVHERLYRSEDLASVDFAEYIEELTSQLFRNHVLSANTIRLKLEVEKISLDIDRAIPCGLILNELISNALKYAFPDGRLGEIRVSLQRTRNSGLVLSVADNGVGLPDEATLQVRRSLGMRLVHSLATQLDTHIEFLRRDPGTEVRWSVETSHV